MAAWTYHVISKKVENHILKHDWLITHLFFINARFNIFRVSCESMKESFRKKKLYLCEWLFWLHRPPFYVILCCCLRLLPSPSQVTHLLNGCMVMFYVMISWVNGRKYENVLQFIIQCIILDFVLVSVVLAMTLH